MGASGNRPENARLAGRYLVCGCRSYTVRELVGVLRSPQPFELATVLLGLQTLFSGRSFWPGGTPFLWRMNGALDQRNKAFPGGVAILLLRPVLAAVDDKHAL